MANEETGPRVLLLLNPSGDGSGTLTVSNAIVVDAATVEFRQGAAAAAGPGWIFDPAKGSWAPPTPPGGTSEETQTGEETNVTQAQDNDAGAAR